MILKNFVSEDVGIQCSDRMWYWGIGFYINCMRFIWFFLSRDDFIIYLDKFEYDVKKGKYKFFIMLKEFYLNVF